MSDEKISRRLHCRECSKLLASKDLVSLNLEIKCPRCSALTSFSGDSRRQLILTDKNGVILTVNSKTEQVTGYSAEEVIGKKPSVWGRQMPAEFYRNMWHKILQKNAAVFRLVNKTKSGVMYPVIVENHAFAGQS
jgi:PAS domain S-box-containing protein